MMLANALVGNPLEAPVLEMALLGGEFVAEERLRVALTGAAAEATVGGARVPSNAAWDVEPGETFQVGAFTGGVRGYLSYRSTDRRRPISRLEATPESLTPRPLPVIAGPQEHLLPLNRFLEEEFVLQMDSDRRGVRLGACPALAHALELPSEPCCVGAVQITPSGQAIIIGPDGPTIGGYPKIAVVIDADLDRVAQLAPGSVIRFERVELVEAHRLRQQRLERLRGLCAQILAETTAGA
jgi:allophanate hydrolase subunit 2